MRLDCDKRLWIDLKVLALRAQGKRAAAFRKAGTKASATRRRGEGGTGDFAGEIGDGDGGEVVERKRFCGGEAGESGDVGAERKKSDAAKGDRVARFFDGNER